MAYDPLSYQTVLLEPGDPSATWVLNSGSNRWARKHPPTSPALVSARLAFDYATGTVVAFGSNDPDPSSCDGSRPDVDMGRLHVDAAPPKRRSQQLRSSGCHVHGV